MAVESYYCEKCNRTMGADQFYGSNNLEKYPTGKLKQCKKCISMHVDNFDPDTYLWILQECDVPYVPDEWSKLLEKYGRDRSKMTGMTILGRYLSKMRLKQYHDYRWSDTAHLQEVANNKMKQAMKSQGYDMTEIDEALEKAATPIPEGEIAIPVYHDPPPNANAALMGGGTTSFEEADDAFEDDLTEEDKKRLRLKWGRYRPEQWVRLEQLYNQMMDSYDIQGAGHIDNLILVCKASLRANELIDIGDIEGFQKVSKVYDSLMKSGKFTAAQNKEEHGEFVDSVSELVELCEKEGFIPRFYIPQPNDQVDATLQDLKHYTRTLVTEEMNLGNLIENAVKEMQRQEEKEEDEDVEEEINYDNIDQQLEDVDYIEHQKFLEEEATLDEESGQ